MPVNPAPPKAAPARKPTAAQATAIAQQAKQGVAAAREQAVNGIFQLVALGMTAREMYADAGAVGMHGPGISRELAAVADSDKRVASFIDYLTTAGPYTGLVMATLPFVLQLGVNHGRISPERALMPGIMNPKELEKKVRDEIEEAKRRRLNSDMAEGVGA